MRDFSSSTLWRISTFHAVLDKTTTSGSLSETTAAHLVAGTLLSGLRRLQADPHEDDLLAVLSVCVHHREPVLLMLEHGPWVWPVSVFPVSRLYHSPRDVTDLAERAALSRLKLLGATRPEVREPGLALGQSDALVAKFRPLSSLLGALALYGPRSTLLTEIAGRAAYRLASGRDIELPDLPGALAPAMLRLRAEASPVRDIARWPGMSVERACRLLNALYLNGGLMVTRSHPAARSEPGGWREMLSRKR